MSDTHPQLIGLVNGLVNSRNGSNGTAASLGPSAHAPPNPGPGTSTSHGGSNGEVQHVSHLAEHIGGLYMDENYSDITLIVQNNSFPAHRVILAARSEYFRALLYGGMRESAESEVELVDTGVCSFPLLLRYIYTGKLSLGNLKEDLVLEVLGLAHKYGFADLETAISEYLKSIVTCRNVCTVFGAAHVYCLRSLNDFCLLFGDRHAPDILRETAFSRLPASAILQFVERDSFCANEIDLFYAVQQWVNNHPQDSAKESIVSQLRLPLIKLDDLLNVVRPSGLIPSDAILDAIKEQTEKRVMDLTYRGFLLPGVNVATTALGATVIEGELKAALLNGDRQNYDMERGFTRHPIDDHSAGIVVQLGMQCIINHVKLLLWDRDARLYSYYVEVSIDNVDWVRVIDYSAYLCRSQQNLYFQSKVVRYIRVMGTHNSVNRVFHLVSMEADYISTPPDIQPSTGLIIARDNVATVEGSASVIEGVSRSRNALLNGDTGHYDWDNGYTCHQLGSGAIVVQLPQPYLVDSFRLLLWDCDDRYYSYFIEVSTDQQNWRRIIDRTQKQCQSWQYLRFERQPVTFIRIVGTFNSANEVFHCVHFECPASRQCLNAIAESALVIQQNTSITSGREERDMEISHEIGNNDVIVVEPIEQLENAEQVEQVEFESSEHDE